MAAYLSAQLPARVEPVAAAAAAAAAMDTSYTNPSNFAVSFIPDGTYSYLLHPEHKFGTYVRVFHNTNNTEWYKHVCRDKAEQFTRSIDDCERWYLEFVSAIHRSQKLEEEWSRDTVISVMCTIECNSFSETRTVKLDYFLLLNCVKNTLVHATRLLIGRIRRLGDLIDLIPPEYSNQKNNNKNEEVCQKVDILSRKSSINLVRDVKWVFSYLTSYNLACETKTQLIDSNLGDYGVEHVSRFASLLSEKLQQQYEHLCNAVIPLAISDHLVIDEKDAESGTSLFFTKKHFGKTLQKLTKNDIADEWGVLEPPFYFPYDNFVQYVRQECDVNFGATFAASEWIHHIQSSSGKLADLECILDRTIRIMNGNTQFQMWGSDQSPPNLSAAALSAVQSALHRYALPSQ